MFNGTSSVSSFQRVRLNQPFLTHSSSPASVLPPIWVAGSVCVSVPGEAAEGWTTELCEGRFSGVSPRIIPADWAPPTTLCTRSQFFDSQTCWRLRRERTYNRPEEESYRGSQGSYTAASNTLLQEFLSDQWKKPSLNAFEHTGVTAAQWKYAGSGMTAGNLDHRKVCRFNFHRSDRITSPL